MTELQASSCATCASATARASALAGIDLTLDGAQIVGIVGPDGAGKTTLLRALAGLLEIEADEARGARLRPARRRHRRYKAHVGYVPQAFSLPRELSVMENLRFTARLHRLAGARVRARAPPSCWRAPAWRRSPIGRPARCRAA